MWQEIQNIAGYKSWSTPSVVRPCCRMSWPQFMVIWSSDWLSHILYVSAQHQSPPDMWGLTPLMWAPPPAVCSMHCSLTSLPDICLQYLIDYSDTEENLKTWWFSESVIVSKQNSGGLLIWDDKSINEIIVTSSNLGPQGPPSERRHPVRTHSWRLDDRATVCHAVHFLSPWTLFLSSQRRT